MQDVCFVGFDTSNYTTSVAVADGAGRVIANIKRPLPVKAGECGLRQSDAVFAHVRNLPDAVEELREAVRGRRVIGVGCSTRPRSVEGSYMPCFLAGRAAAGSFSSAVDAPLFEVSHQDGHLMAALYSSGAGEAVAASPFLAFHVSGGTTEVLYVRPKDEVFSAERIGGSADLNAGQCVDRIGVMLGLSFPCGRELEALATTNSARYPRPRISVKGTECNLSGLENLARKLWEERGDAAMVSAYALDFIGATLEGLTAGADERYPGLPVLYAGGVMSNRILQVRLAKRGNAYFAEPQFSADNAAGVALLARRRFFHLI